MHDDQPDKESYEFWEQRVDAELAKDPQPTSRIADIGFLFGRFFTRLARIACGIAILWVVVMGFDKAGEILSKPFSALSPLELLGGLGIGIGCLWGIATAFSVAFGSGVSREEHEVRKLEDRRSEILGRLMEQERIKARHDWNAEASYQALYSVGRFVGRLKSFIRQITK